MPLVIISGLPSSGKTTRAKEILNYFNDRFNRERQTNRIHLINDESLGISKDSYQDTRVDEQHSRGAMLSAVERLLSKDDLIIADGMNYIKGFRYQLYCVARAVGTPHCVVYCGVSIDTAREWNTKRGAEGYGSTVFNELVSRFEEPDDRNRWDSPLFTVLSDDTSVSCDAIWDAVIVRSPKPPNQSTVVKPASETSYLYELEKTTQEIVDAVLEAQKHNIGGGNVKIAGVNQQISFLLASVTILAYIRMCEA
ncbi:5167_t:CDS:2 [Paraglomus occultum]|uniref:5167_t:CDS:1 n=1 Tax=Paraglomus occultum TaxID=144539 RepID=A0A9N8W320_9GLOM|nr:5167_t:CDS:2 [Paraglomus occultum]